MVMPFSSTQASVMVASPKILLRYGISTQVLHIQDRISRDVENQIGCGCRHIFLEFQEWLNAKGQHGIEELRNQNDKIHAPNSVDMLVMPRFPNKQTWILLHRLLRKQRCRVRALCCVRATQARVPCSATWYEIEDVHRHSKGCP